MKALAVLALLGGCITDARNAPGIVDLREPRAGTDYQPAGNAGIEGMVVWAVPSMAIGTRTELSGELRFEPYSTGGTSMFVPSATALAAGVATGKRYYLELQHRTLLADEVPAGVGGGVVFDGRMMPGIQASARYIVLSVRGRAFVDGSVELTVGYELPLPFLFGHAR